MQPILKTSTVLLSYTLLFAVAQLPTHAPGAVASRLGKALPASEDQAQASDPQLESLLQIKAAIDAKGGVLKHWSRESGQNAGYCSWKEIQCANNMVTNITVRDLTYRWYEPENHVRGTLPPVSAFSGLKSLKILELSADTITGTLPADWSQLTQLEELRLDDHVNGTLPAAWGSLTNLRKLVVGVNDPGSTDYADRPLTGPIPDSFQHMTQLEELNMYNLNLSGTLPSWIGGFTKLKGLAFYRCSGLSGTIPDSWQALKALYSLQLDSNNITGTIPGWLGSLVELRELSLYNNSLSGSIPASLGNLSKLTDLNLGFNRLTGPLLEGFGNLHALGSLDLEENFLSGAIPSSWSNIQLESFHVSLGCNRNLTGPFPKGFSALCWGTGIVGSDCTQVSYCRTDHPFDGWEG